MVEGCFKAGKSYDFGQIVDVFECIGQQSKSSDEALDTVGRFNEVLSDQFQIDPLQASLFAARILDYQPAAGSTSESIRADLAGEMMDVVINPQSRISVNDTASIGIKGLDRFREMGAGVESSKTELYARALESTKSGWNRNEVGAHLMVRTIGGGSFTRIAEPDVNMADETVSGGISAPTVLDMDRILCRDARREAAIGQLNGTLEPSSITEEDRGRLGRLIMLMNDGGVPVKAELGGDGDGGSKGKSLGISINLTDTNLPSCERYDSRLESSYHRFSSE